MDIKIPEKYRNDIETATNLLKLDESIKTKIEHEISRIDKLLNDVKPLLDLCKLKEPDIIEMTASAQVLHSFYNGIESIIVLFFKYMNEKLPNDNKWHKTLFEMAYGDNSKNIIEKAPTLHNRPVYPSLPRPAPSGF